MVPVSFASFPFHDQEFALGTGGDAARALYWVEQRALLVADLHLEKASWYARGGQMLPPYDSRETIGRLAQAVQITGARRVFCLGDNFHDAGGPDRLEAEARAALAALIGATDWVWITGNHDVGGASVGGAAIPGTHLPQCVECGIVLRHEAQPGETRAEVSGHFHPRLRVGVRGRTIRRACVVTSATRMVLPAFGALTGGLDADSPAIRAALKPAAAADALVPAAGGLARFPLWRASDATLAL